MPIAGERAGAMREQLDLSRWAVVAFKDETGLGRMAQDIRRVLQIGRHIVIPSERLPGLPPNLPNEYFLKRTDSAEVVQERMKGLQGIILLERCAWHADLMRIAKELKVATVCVPMWEWFRGDEPEFKRCTLFACPTRYTLKVVREYGFSNAVHVQWTLDLSTLPRRSITGKARLFIHNAGLVDYDDRKGTRDVIEAFKRVPRSDIKLIVRIQQEVPLPDLDDRITVQFGNLDNHGVLYNDGDVAVQPSKMEGLGFMVLEPVCAGMPVLTTDYPPMNEFVRQPEMRVATRWFSRRAFPTQWVRQAHLKLPKQSDLIRKMTWCADNDMSSISAQNRQFGENLFSRERIISQWHALLNEALDRNSA